MNIRNGTIEDFDEILNLQLQLEDAEIEFDNNLKKHCFNTEKGKELIM